MRHIQVLYRHLHAEVNTTTGFRPYTFFVRFKAILSVELEKTGLSQAKEAFRVLIYVVMKSKRMKYIVCPFYFATWSCKMFDGECCLCSFSSTSTSRSSVKGWKPKRLKCTVRSSVQPGPDMSTASRAVLLIRSHRPLLCGMAISCGLQNVCCSCVFLLWVRKNYICS